MAKTTQTVLSFLFFGVITYALLVLVAATFTPSDTPTSESITIEASHVRISNNEFAANPMFYQASATSTFMVSATPFATNTPRPTSTVIFATRTVSPPTQTPGPTSTRYGDGPPTSTQSPGDGTCDALNVSVVVNTFADENDGVCTANHCSIREAVLCGMTNDNLNILIPGGNYTLTAGPVFIPGRVGLSGSTNPLTVIETTSNAPIFEIGQSGDVHINYMSLRQGNSVVLNRGSLRLNGVQVENGSAQNGGGVYNAFDSDLWVINSTISDNEAYQNGGGIYNLGRLFITNSLIQNNRITDGPAANRRGAGIYSSGSMSSVFIIESSLVGNTGADQGGGMLIGSAGGTLVNSTISGNEALAAGGGIAVESVLEDGTPPSLDHVTITQNRAHAGGGFAFLGDLGNPADLVNSILAGNTDLNGNPDDVDGSIRVVGRSLIGGMGGDFIMVGDVIRTDDPGLLPLENTQRGGLLHPLAPDSPAIDAASSAHCQALDQQDAVRPEGYGCDIGAVEYVADDAPNLAPQPNRLDTQTPLLTWGAIDWAVAYEIQIDNNRDFNSRDFQETANSASITTTPLENGQYFWRVRALRENGCWASWSAISTFVIAAAHP